MDSFLTDYGKLRINLTIRGVHVADGSGLRAGGVSGGHGGRRQAEGGCGAAHTGLAAGGLVEIGHGLGGASQEHRRCARGDGGVVGAGEDRPHLRAGAHGERVQRGHGVVGVVHRHAKV